MANRLNVVIEVTQDGQPLQDSPYVFTADFQQYDLIDVTQETSEADVYTVVPGGGFPIVQAFLALGVNEPINWRLANQQTSDLPVAASGMLMALGCNIAFGGLRNLKVNSPDGTTQIVGFVMGKGVPLAIPSILLIDERWEADYPTPATLFVDERWEASGAWLLYDRHNPANVYEVTFGDPFIEVLPSSGPAVGGILLNDDGMGGNWSYFIQDGQAQHDNAPFADQRPWDNSHTLEVDNVTQKLNYVF